MKEIEIVRKETMILLPGQIFRVPDNIATQLTRRGSGKLHGKDAPKDEKKEA
jgi:hypothetical protein